MSRELPKLNGSPFTFSMVLPSRHPLSLSLSLSISLSPGWLTLSHLPYRYFYTSGMSARVSKMRQHLPHGRKRDLKVRRALAFEEQKQKIDLRRQVRVHRPAGVLSAELAASPATNKLARVVRPFDAKGPPGWQVLDGCHVLQGAGCTIKIGFIFVLIHASQLLLCRRRNQTTPHCGLSCGGGRRSWPRTLCHVQRPQL